jgi:formylglycine-generating enzyme required for sulfatase activity
LAKLPASNFQIIDLGEFWESLPVKSGSFSMGSPTGEAERKGEETPHQIRVGDFLIGKYEVSQEEYSSLMGANPSRFRNPKRPVEQVSWFDAVEYCNRRSAREGLQPAYSINGREVRWNRNADGYRLPTEAEWEYACRAGTTGPFSTGANITTDQANYNGNFSYNGARRGRDRTETTQSGSFAPNPWGIYDMHGNVWDWCWDWKAAYPAENAANPAGPASGSYKTARGGSWRVGAQSLRSALRGSNPPEDRGDGLGFRLVRSVAR